MGYVSAAAHPIWDVHLRPLAPSSSPISFCGAVRAADLPLQWRSFAPLGRRKMRQDSNRRPELGAFDGALAPITEPRVPAVVQLRTCRHACKRSELRRMRRFRSRHRRRSMPRPLRAGRRTRLRLHRASLNAIANTFSTNPADRDRRVFQTRIAAMRQESESAVLYWDRSTRASFPVSGESDSESHPRHATAASRCAELTAVKVHPCTDRLD